MTTGLDLDAVNHSRHHPGDEGFYESFFVRANHPTRPLAFWIRYTLFSPAGRPADAIGELWAVVFDGEAGQHVVSKIEVPLSQCTFSADAFAVAVGDASLGPGALRGAAGADVAWNLTFDGDERPLLLLAERLYAGPLPKAKSLVALPLATFGGTLTTDGRQIDVHGWVGSQNHNWGSRHTDEYAWGQVAGFENHPDTFLELSTARVQIGPLRSPWLTPLVLRHDGNEHRLNGIFRSLRAHGRFRPFAWDFATADDDIIVRGRIWAQPDAFVGLRYANPPGGQKHCLNTKIASCELRITDRRTGVVQGLTTDRRAAFEILTDDTAHGIPIRA